MRNLKRALSLGLTAAMISGLMVMGTSAASYADVTSENNVEAIDVLQTVGIMVGDENGNFNPDQNVTRNEMAVIMSNLMEYNVATYKDTSPFTDVPSWAEPYVAACWTNGITSGYSDTIYGGSDTVTTAQAALMLMKALGYFQYASDFGSDWQLATTRQANAIDLFVGVDSGVTAPMTRNDVAQLVLNTLEAGTVEASTDGSWTIGDVTINNNVKYSYITSNQPYAVAISDDRSTDSTTDAGRSIVELGEQLYMGDLQLNDKTSDDFERPSRTWTYDGAEIGTYMKDELIVATYTEGVTGRELYDLLTSSTIREYSLEAYLNGSQVIQEGRDVIEKNDLVRSNNNDLLQTGDGVLTQVFMDLNDKEITITSIDTWLAKSNSAYNTNSETLSVRIYDEATNGSEGHTEVLDLDEIPAIEDVAADQFLLVNRTLKDRNDYETVAIADPEILTGTTITKFSNRANSDVVPSLFDSLTADGTSYDSAMMALYNEDVLDLYDQDLLTDMTYNVILDQYGYAIGVELDEGSLNYVFITGYDRNGSHIAINTADAAAIFTDGTMDVISVNVSNTNKNLDRNNDGDVDEAYVEKYDLWTSRGDGEHQVNRWYTYTVTESGVYTLKPVNSDEMLVTDYDNVTDNDPEVINCSNVWVRDYEGDADDLSGDGTNLTTNNRRAYGNDDSVYITVEAGDVDLDNNVDDSAITDVTGVYTGVQDVDIEMSPSTKLQVPQYIYSLVDDDQYIIASIVLGEAQGSVENYAVILDAPTSEERLSDGTYVWTFDAIMGGEKVEMTARSEYQDVITDLDWAAETKEVMELRMDADGYVTGADPVDPDKVANFGNADDGMENFEVFDQTFTVADMPTLEMNGRTMQIRDGSGLTFITDAPTVLWQRINNKGTYTAYSSVQDAYNDLADENENAAGLQFRGRIVAVLNSQGVAEWAYIESLTPVNSSDPGYGDNGSRTENGNAALVVYDGYTAEYVYADGNGRAVFTFGVPTTWNGSRVNYTVTAYVNGDRVYRDYNAYGTANGGEVDGQINNLVYNRNDSVVIYVKDITRYVAPVTVPVDNDVAGTTTQFTAPDNAPVNDNGNLNLVPGTAVTLTINGAPIAPMSIGAETVNTFVVGQQYVVYINDVEQAPVTCTVANQLTVTYTYVGNETEIAVTDIRTWEDDEPITKPIESVAITTSSLENLTTESALPTVQSGTAGVSAAIVWKDSTGAKVESFSAAGTYTYEITLTVTAEAGLADGATYTLNGGAAAAIPENRVITGGPVTVRAEEPTPESGITGVTVEPSETNPDEDVFTVEYTGEKPTAKEIEDYINQNDLLDGQTGYVLEDGKGGYDVYVEDENGKAEKVGTVDFAGTFNVYLCGKNVGTVSTTAEKDVVLTTDQVVRGPKDATLIDLNTLAAARNWTLTPGLSNSTLTISAANAQQLTADVYLNFGYQLSAAVGSGNSASDLKAVGEITYTLPGGKTDTAALENNYFPVGTQFAVKGTIAKPENATDLTLMVGGKVADSVKVADLAKGAVANYEFELTAEMVEAETVTIGEYKSNETKLMIAGKPFTTTGDVAGEGGVTIQASLSNVVPAGEYLLVMDGTLAQEKALEITVDVDQINVPKLNLTDAYRDADGYYYLVPAQKVTINSPVDLMVEGTYEKAYNQPLEMTDGTVTVYLPADAENITLGSTDAASTYELYEQVGDGEAREITGSTVGGNVLFTWSVPAAKADETVTLTFKHSLEGTLAVIEDKGENIDTDYTLKGEATISGNTISTSAPTDGEYADGNYFDNSEGTAPATADLARFLKALHVDGGAQKIVFNGTTYTWGDGNTASKWSDGENTLVSAIVDEYFSVTDFAEYTKTEGADVVTFSLTVDGETLNFKVTVPADLSALVGDEEG